MGYVNVSSRAVALWAQRRDAIETRVISLFLDFVFNFECLCLQRTPVEAVKSRCRNISVLKYDLGILFYFQHGYNKRGYQESEQRNHCLESMSKDLVDFLPSRALKTVNSSFYLHLVSRLHRI